jgi:hypothetical protein
VGWWEESQVVLRDQDAKVLILVSLNDPSPEIFLGHEQGSGVDIGHSYSLEGTIEGHQGWVSFIPGLRLIVKSRLSEGVRVGSRV